MRTQIQKANRNELMKTLTGMLSNDLKSQIELNDIGDNRILIRFRPHRRYHPKVHATTHREFIVNSPNVKPYLIPYNFVVEGKVDWIPNTLLAFVLNDGYDCHSFEVSGSTIRTFAKAIKRYTKCNLDGLRATRVTQLK
jgi:hypothetical protein